ncbi:MAG: pyridoxal phosphate-dependent aminotransferase [Fretibacterium sp.]|nr:pyridoxal phosphate-dependent aminotransferase [Fretibacterium sp.]
MIQDRLNTALYGARRSPIREFSRLASRTPDCVRLTLGEPDFETPEPIRQAAGEALARGETHYIENCGTAELREKIAAFEKKRGGLDYAPDEVIVTVGATEAIFTALFGILNPGDEVIVPIPAFVLYERIIGLCRAVFVPLDTREDGFQINGEKLAGLISPRTKAIILNSPNNPTGCVYSGESLRAVRRAAEGKDIFVLCDDVYNQLCYTGPCRGFAEESADLKPQVLVVQSFSKPYAMTGWRMGYLLAERRICERLALLHQFMVTSSAAPFQRACVAALDQDPGEMVREYRRRRDYVLERLRGMKLQVQVPEGAFYVFPSIAEFGLDSTAFCTRLLQEARVAVTPGLCFGADDHVRISCCCGEESLRKGMDRLESFIETAFRGGGHGR